MRAPIKKTAPALRWNCETQSWEHMGVLTCECTGEWSGRVKSWTEVGKPCGNQYSCARTKQGQYYFVLEATE